MYSPGPQTISRKAVIVTRSVISERGTEITLDLPVSVPCMFL